MANSKKKVDQATVDQWTIVAARAADSKKAQDTVILRVSEVLGITDSFVITGASNNRLVKTIAEEVEQQVKEIGGPAPIRIEGLADARWVLMDYNDFVVHIFLEETREFYDLERLWKDAPRIEWKEQGAAVNQ